MKKFIYLSLIVLGFTCFSASIKAQNISKTQFFHVNDSLLDSHFKELNELEEHLTASGFNPSDSTLPKKKKSSFKRDSSDDWKWILGGAGVIGGCCVAGGVWLIYESTLTSPNYSLVDDCCNFFF